MGEEDSARFLDYFAIFLARISGIFVNNPPPKPLRSSLFVTGHGGCVVRLFRQRTPRRRSAGVPPAVRRRSAAGPPPVRRRSARDPHRCRTGAAPVPRRCRRCRCFFSFFRFAFFIFPDFSAISHFSCPRFHFAFSCPRFHFAFSCPRFHFAFFLHSRRWRPPVIARRGKCRVSSLGVLGRVGERGHPGGRRQREQRRAGVHARSLRPPR